MKAKIDATLRELNESNRVRYRVSADWLQIHVKTPGNFGDGNTVRYRIKKSGQTKIFRSVYSITDLYGKHICAYATDANDCILQKGHGILKFDNSQLYIHDNLKYFVENFLNELDFKFVGITRLDICFDFHKFFNNRDPHNFIKGFLRGDILKVMRSQFRAAGDHDKENIYNWLYFGNHSSEVSYKIYNKSCEQDAKGRKPWIWEDWQKNSLLNTDEPVWRIEFTVNSTTANFCNEFTTCAFHSLEILRRNNLYSLFMGLFNHYFRFVKRDLSKSRKDRMPAIVLIEFDNSFEVGSPFDIYRFINPERTASTRTHKIFINQLLKHQQELRDFDDILDSTSTSIIEKVIDKYGLHDWAKQRQIDFSAAKINPLDNGAIEVVDKLINKYDLQGWAKKKGIKFSPNRFIYPYPIPGYRNYSGNIANYKEEIE